MRDNESQELEDYIEEWHYDEPSYQFAKALGRYLFDFINHLRKQELSERTLRKHRDNVWCIGYLECAFGYQDDFAPGNVFYGPEPGYDYEFKRRFSDSEHAVNSYRTTWRKLYSYTKALGHLDGTKRHSHE